jgi:hypothetical protein
VHGALNFVPFWYHPDGKVPPDKAYAAIADTVMLMLGVRGDSART